MINKEGLHSIIKSTLNISINKNSNILLLHSKSSIISSICTGWEDITGLWEDRRGWSRRRRVWRSLSEVSLLWSGPGSSSCTLLQTFPVSSPAGQVNINCIIFCNFFYHFVLKQQICTYIIIITGRGSSTWRSWDPSSPDTSVNNASKSSLCDLFQA